MLTTVEDKKFTIEDEKEDAERTAEEFKKLNREQQVAVKNIMIGMKLASEVSGV